MTNPLQFVDVPMDGWHRPRPGEMEITGTVRPDAPATTIDALVARYDLFLANGAHPDWMWCVYQEGALPPVAIAMFGPTGQAVPLPTKLARVLIGKARKQAGARPTTH